MQKNQRPTDSHSHTGTIECRLSAGLSQTRLQRKFIYEIFTLACSFKSVKVKEKELEAGYDGENAKGVVCHLYQ